MRKFPVFVPEHIFLLPQVLQLQVYGARAPKPGYDRIAHARQSRSAGLRAEAIGGYPLPYVMPHGNGNLL